ncbi:uncharacterized protein LOC129611110 [Condylostylus longicornis]|uniref:uncharacterized protein LOC129611110 n=1 Tax=Condylostylus longicornis TaxID=2530218 RepID=UPI00244DE051|nr:uncharacterized protein LOC129611110 [Condylostylus longicornis]
MSFKANIPKSFHNRILFASSLNFRQLRSTVFLTNKFGFYEYINNTQLSEIDLSEFFNDLSPTEQKTLMEVRNKEFSVNEQSQTTRIARDSSKTHLIEIGKYIKYYGNSKAIYVILKVFNKILILKKANGYKVVKVLDKVEKFEICDLNTAYQADIYIFFQGTQKPDLIKVEEDDIPEIHRNIPFAKAKSLLEVTKKVRTEYERQKQNTRKNFMSLKNRSTFGCNIIRSLNIDEKSILGKYGDIWTKIYNQYLIIGIPVVNNCTENLTTLLNIKPILSKKNEDQISFEYSFYELEKNVNISDTENIKYLKFEDTKVDKISFDENFVLIQNNNLKPGSIAVILLKSSIDNFRTLSTSYCNIFINFELAYEQNIFHHSVFFKSLKIPVIDLLDSYKKVSNIQTMSNFLTVAETSKRHVFLLQNEIKDENETFLTIEIQNILKNKLNFKEINHKSICEKIDEMEIDDGYIDINKEGFVKTYICFDSCFWNGSILKFQVDEITTNNFYFTLHTKSDSHALMFIHSLLEDLPTRINFKLLQNCDLIHNVHFLTKKLKDVISLSINNFNCLNKLSSPKRNEILNFQKERYSKELETDLLL